MHKTCDKIPGPVALPIDLLLELSCRMPVPRQAGRETNIQPLDYLRQIPFSIRFNSRLLLSLFESRVGAVVKTLVFHQRGPGSIPYAVICGLSLLILYSVLRAFFPGYSGFPLSPKTFDLI